MNKINSKNQIFIIGTILILLFSIGRAFFWFGFKDEPYYFTTALQMLKGDVLFTQIWGFVNMQTFILYPLIKMFVLITGGTEGMFIVFRILYILVHFAIGIFIYHRIKDYSPISYIPVWMFLLFNPMNHQLLSYNSISFIFGFLGVVLLVTNKSKIEYFICGICYALSVLCQPLLGVEFVIVSIIIFILYRKDIKSVLPKYLLFVGGCIITAIPVLYYLFRYITVKKLIKFLPYNLELLSDLHNPEGIVGKVKYYTWALFPNQKIFGPLNTQVLSALLLVVIIVLFIVQLIRNRRKADENFILIKCLICACLLYSIVCAIATLQLPTTVVMVPWFFVGIVLYGKCNSDKLKKLFKVTIAWTVIHGISFITSNGGMKVFAIAIFPTVLVTTMVVYDVFKGNVKLKEKKLVYVYIISILCMAVVGASFAIRTIGNRKIATEGPNKYISDTKEMSNNYKNTIEDMKKINKNKLNTLILTHFSQAHMEYEGRPVQFTTLFEFFDEKNIQRLNTYYKLYPNKKPDAIYASYGQLKGITFKNICDNFGFDNSKTIKLKGGYYNEKR